MVCNKSGVAVLSRIGAEKQALSRLAVPNSEGSVVYEGGLGLVRAKGQVSD